MKKVIVHYVHDDVFETGYEEHTAECGVQVKMANSTENPQAVTCQRCQRVMAKMLGGQPGDISSTNQPDKEKIMEVEAVTAQPEADQTEMFVPATPTSVDEALAEIKEKEYKIVADGTQLDDADNTTEACKKAVEASLGLGDDVIVEVVKTGITRFRYKDGHHISLKGGKPAKPSKSVTDIGKHKEDKAKKEPKPSKEPKPQKTAKSAEATNDCVCGCGGKTRGNFVPGHDARVHGWMKKIAKGEVKLKDLAPIAQKYIKEHTAA